jgi:hypothetical protein
MSISNAQATFGTQALGTPSRPNHSGSVTVGLTVATMPLDDSDMIFANRAEIAQDSSATLDLSDFTADTAGGITGGTVILDPTGVNNAIKITSTDPDIEQAEILIDDDVDRTQLTVQNGGPLLEIISGDKRVMRVVADFGDGEISFNLFYVGVSLGKPRWTDNGQEMHIRYALSWTSGSIWRLIDEGTEDNARFTSSEDVATPDLVTTWTPVSSATGTPTVTAHPATAAQVIAAINAEEIEGITAENAPGNDGSGFIAGVEMTLFDYQEIGASWSQPTTDFEGSEYPLTDKITAVSVACTTGGVSVEIGGIATTLTAGGKFQIANNDGCAGTDQTLEITSIEPSSTVDVAVIAKSLT